MQAAGTYVHPCKAFLYWNKTSTETFKWQVALWTQYLVKRACSVPIAVREGEKCQFPPTVCRHMSFTGALWLSSSLEM